MHPYKSRNWLSEKKDAVHARAKSIDREAPVIGVDNENFVDLRVEEIQVVNDGEVFGANP